MRNLLALVGLVVVLVGGLGWYLGWYKIGRNSGGTDIQFNNGKVENDVKKGREAVEGVLERNGKSVPGTPMSRPLDPPSGGWSVPELPKLPTPPTPASSVDLNPDGTLKIKIDLPPPPVFPGNK